MVHIRDGWIRIHIKHILTAVIVLFALALAGFVGLLEYSTKPGFCNSCHIMEPYYNAWKESKHNTVSCVECHYAPGVAETLQGKIQGVVQVVKYVTRTYGTKPYAEIQDASCLRVGCHDRRLIKSTETFMGSITFDHAPHLTEERRGRQLRCTSCHSQIVQGEHIAVTEETCFLCHFKGKKESRTLEPLGGCTGCHKVPEKDIEVAGITFNHKDFVSAGTDCTKCHLEVVQGDGYAPKEVCLNCHGEPDRLEKYDDIPFIHANHVTEHKVDCGQCHRAIQHKVSTTVGVQDMRCDLCHVSKHEGVKRMFMGVGGRGVPNMPGSMFKTHVDCKACHILPQADSPFTEFQGKTFEPSPLSCRGCHGEGAEDLLTSSKQLLDDTTAEVEKLLEETKKLLAQAKVDETEKDKVSRLLADAEYNCNFVKFGKGVHNVEYSLALLEASEKGLKEAKEVLGSSVG